MEKLNIIKTDSLGEEKLAVYTSLSENQIKHIYEPEQGLFIAESPVVIERALDAGYEPESVLTDNSHIEDIKELFSKKYKGSELDVYLVDDSVLSGIKGFEMTRGALCAFYRRPLLEIENICKEATRIAVMEEVQNPTNVGAIFRSAAAMGIEAVILTSGSADPLYRRAVRVSMGNVFLVPWTIADANGNIVDRLKKLGFTTLAMALKEDTVSIDEPVLKAQERLAIFLGTESEGLMDATIEACDYTVKIPMREGVDSLNVAAASAVAFWELGKK